MPGRVMVPGMPGMPGLSGSALPVDPAVVAAAAVAAESGRPAQPSFAGPTEAHIEHARGLLARIPEATQNYLHTRQGAVAAVLGLLVSPDPQLRPRQLALAGQAVGMEPDYLDAASQVISELHRSLQLPAIDIALHSIRELPYDYKMALTRTIHAIEEDRPHQDLFRWMLRRVVLRHIEDQHDDGSARHDRRLADLQAEAMTIYAVIAHFNSSGAELTQPAYEAALAQVGFPAAPIAPIEELTFDRLDGALERLARLDRPSRQAFVAGATAAVLHDGKTTVEEAELIRVVADAVRQPVPPLLAI
jgi:hypothetical protein